MADIRCPAPHCNLAWLSTTDPKVLLKHLHMQKRTAYSDTAPTTASMATGVKAEKVKHPVVSTYGTSKEWTYFVQCWSQYKHAP
ncbi:hypothetical protein ElyMa_002347400 [Elysia marginata]|uniref:Uncharacterized protein n=1 Tax=Elysia marginata TaxID=1093978 RepID=A0AAV4G7P5_9GAST|nr:hypothetical protein ElyMa_002347400 [Elysia marginata]